ncbi:MAG: beta-eliminating lyase-related protein, partial [Candidatus Thorarchaeota archaeon]
IIAGTAEFIYESHRIRKKLGGGMRQAGIIAAPGIVALEKMVDRLKDDHDNAKLLYESIKDIPNLIVNEPDTNILFLELQNLSISQMKLSEELAKDNIKVYGGYGVRTRLVLNRMVDREDLDRISIALKRLLK